MISVSSHARLQSQQLRGAAPQQRCRHRCLAAAATAGRPQQLAARPPARPAAQPHTRWPLNREQQQQRRATVTAAAAAVAPAAAPAAAAAVAQAFWPALVQAWNANPASVLVGAGACILGVALSVFLLASIPTMLALRRSALAMEALLLTVQAEVPDTAATLRLSGLELADCIQEVGALSTDLSEGWRASARAVASAEAGIRQGADLTKRAVKEVVLPQARGERVTQYMSVAELAVTTVACSNDQRTNQNGRVALLLVHGRAAGGRLLCV